MIDNTIRNTSPASGVPSQLFIRLYSGGRPVSGCFFGVTQMPKKKQRKGTKRQPPMGTWHSITDDREKYQAYLCSREWAVKREAVHERADGKCERCKCLPIDAVHHLTYERKYKERLQDLQGICGPCHQFTHGKDDFDPKKHSRIFRWLNSVKEANTKPMPFDLAADLVGETYLIPEVFELLRGARILHAADLEDAATALLAAAPFAVPYFWLCGPMAYPPDLKTCYELCGFSMTESEEFFHGEGEE